MRAMLMLYIALADARLPALAEVPNTRYSLGWPAASPIFSSMATYKQGKSVTTTGSPSTPDAGLVIRDVQGEQFFYSPCDVVGCLL